jgi:hypothetical protein
MTKYIVVDLELLLQYYYHYYYVHFFWRCFEMTVRWKSPSSTTFTSRLYGADPITKFFVRYIVKVLSTPKELIGTTAIQLHTTIIYNRQLVPCIMASILPWWC